MLENFKKTFIPLLSVSFKNAFSENTIHTSCKKSMQNMNQQNTMMRYKTIVLLYIHNWHQSNTGDGGCRFALLVKSLQRIRKIQLCGNSCRRTLTLFELFSAVFLFICFGVGTTFPYLFVSTNTLASSKKFTFDFLKIAEDFWFLIFCTHNKQWWLIKHNLTCKA